MIDLATIQLHGSAKTGKSLGVIGISIGLSGKIVRVYSNTPAEGAGLLKGDKIVKAIDLEGRKDIDGRPYTLVSMIVKREGSAPLVIIVRRLPHQAIDNKDVRGYFKGREDFVIGDDD